VTLRAALASNPSVVPDALETAWQNMQQEPAHELVAISPCLSNVFLH
jgi:hypothetical protein